MSLRVLFGNLSVKAMEENLRITLNDEDREWFNKHRSDYVEVTDDVFHIFAEPFKLMAGKNIVNEVVERLSKYDYSNVKRTLVVEEVIKKERGI